MRHSLIVFVVLPGCSLFASSPAMHAPLKDRLAAADTSRIEDAARSCLEKAGFKVDPVGGEAQGANVVSAQSKSGRLTVYVQPPDVSPRVTGPEYGDPFWKCLGNDLANPQSAPPPASSTPEAPEAPEAK
jgi:hypothetical protein